MRATGMLGLAIVAAASCCHAADRPNVILMMADDLGWGDVGFNGNKIIRTPHLDEMASSGLVFRRFYAAAPVCSPTRGSCLTGRHPYRYGVFSANAGHMLPRELTLAEALKSAGYATGHFGKWHLGTLTKTERESNRGGPKGAAHYSPPWENGFEETFSTEAKVPTYDPLVRPRGVARRTWWDPAGKSAAPYGTNYWSNGRKVRGDLTGDDSKLIVDRTIPFIRKSVQSKRPFFAVVWFHAPHLPVVAGPRHTAMYGRFEKYSQHYFGCITALDEQVGRLRKELRDLHVADDTLLCFCADNGPEGKHGKAPGSAGPFRGRKRDLYEGGIRVPAIVEWPKRIKAGTTDFPVCTSDYFPTILAAAGLSTTGQLQPADGIDLDSVFAGKARERSRAIGFQSGGQSAWMTHRYKLLRIGPGRKQRSAGAKTQVLLFDLLADPGEAKNLAADRPDLVRKLTAELTAWQQSCRQSLTAQARAVLR